MLAKNSWGKTWGLNGYVKIALNDFDVCGVLSMAFTVHMDKVWYEDMQEVS